MDLPELLQACQDTAWSLREQPPSGVDRLAQALHQLREAASALSDAARDVEAHLAEAMGKDKEVVVEGLGTLERKASPIKPRWDAERLLPIVAALSRDERLVNERTGEIETDSDAAVRVLNEVASIAYFRVGELSKRGVDAKAFREQEGWRTTIRIHPAS
jgi:hypothetical protein